jgi:CheY-like chemotaxis protein
MVGNIYRNKFLVAGYQVEVALDGAAGIELVRKFRPDAVLLDLVLPKVPGVEVLKVIRSDPESAKIPVIVFSNTYLTTMLQEAWKAGATKCLSKAGCTPKQVIDAMRSALNINGASAAASSTTITKSASESAQAKSVETDLVSSNADGEFQAELRKAFISDSAATMATIRHWLQGMIKAESETIRLKQIHGLYRQIHTVTGSAGIIGLSQIAQMTDALEALLRELQEEPSNINTSTIRTVASAVDCLAILFEQATVSGKEASPYNILVVDDEAISRRAISYALEKAELKSVTVEDPLAAFQILSQKKFDLIFLDIGMPEMNGFELCSKIRMLPAYKNTPVVFITCLTDLENRANSTMSGGNDFIAKPFLYVELSVKALVHLLRGRLEAAKK